MIIDEIKKDFLYVIDDVVPSHINSLLQNRAVDSKYTIHKGSRFEKENDHYMACYLNDADLFTVGVLPYISKTLNHLHFEQYIVRSYINMYAQFTPTTAHVDENSYGNMTCLYWFNTRWERNWGGELTFYDVDGRNYTIEYKPGRLLIFDGTIMHRVNPLTAFSKEFRFCLTIKCVNKQTRDFVYNIPNALQISSGIENE